ncbi:MAG: FAD-dependent oxidoreductase [Candidatus Rokubacteria bacterium]|nr:FAD-dependent oxidoreductase [Candidatus Rokubacteria bacterium]
MSQRAVVIGMGAIGIAAAYYLQRAGWQVTLADRGDVGQGCSYANACLIVPSHSHPVPGPGVIWQGLRWMLAPESPLYVRPRVDRRFLRWLREFRRFCSAEAAERGFHALVGLSRASLELFEELARDAGVGFFYERKGLLNIYLSDAGLAAAVEEQHRLDLAGFRARVLTGPEAREAEPALGAGVRGALVVEGEAHGNCFEYVRALAQELEKRGARLLRHRRVTRIVVEAGRVAGVVIEEPRDELPTDVAVLAAGAWTGELTEPLGVVLPLEPAKGYSCTIDSYAGAPRLPLLVHEKRIAITPLGPRLRFGGTLELTGHDLSLNQTRYQAVIKGARATLDHRLELRNEAAWCGLRPLTPDGLPIIDRVPGVEGLIVATGHGMLGFTQSPATGKLVTELASASPPRCPGRRSGSPGFRSPD